MATKPKPVRTAPVSDEAGDREIRNSPVTPDEVAGVGAPIIPVLTDIGARTDPAIVRRAGVLARAGWRCQGPDCRAVRDLTVEPKHPGANPDDWREWRAVCPAHRGDAHATVQRHG